MLALSLLLPLEKVEEIIEYLENNNALAVSLVEGKEEPLFQESPNQTPLWKITKIQALFEDAGHLNFLVEKIKKQFQIIFHYEIAQIENRDWVSETQKHFSPQCYANLLWVLPTWASSQNHSPAIIIEPGLAFGTGAHPTTAMCLQWLAENPPQDLMVVDYGCGSGILALSALALGAKTVYAIDHDEQALQATKNNAQLNEFIRADQLQILLPQAMLLIKADLIIANILSGPVIQLMETFLSLSHVGTKLILSGMLNSEIQKVISAYQKYFKVLKIINKEEWGGIVIEFRGVF